MVLAAAFFAVGFFAAVFLGAAVFLAAAVFAAGFLAAVFFAAAAFADLAAGFAAVAVWQGTGYFCLCRRLRADGHRPEPELAGLYVRASAGARRPPELLQSAAIPVPLVEV